MSSTATPAKPARTVATRLEPEEVQAIDRIAAERGMTRGEWLRQLTRRSLQRARVAS